MQYIQLVNEVLKAVFGLCISAVQLSLMATLDGVAKLVLLRKIKVMLKS